MKRYSNGAKRHSLYIFQKLFSQNAATRFAVLLAIVAITMAAAATAITIAKTSKEARESAEAERSEKAELSGAIAPGSAHEEVVSPLPDDAEEVDTGSGEPATDGARLLDQESYWMHRVGYPTNEFEPSWIREAVQQDSLIPRLIPNGRIAERTVSGPLALSPGGFTALGPMPERMTGCSGCFDYGTTEGRVNSIAIDPTTTTPGSIVAYIATVGGGIWKSTNCCSSSTTWSATTDDAAVSTTSVDSVVIDPNNHNIVYAGTGDLNYGSFSMGSQGILKSTNGGGSWSVLGADVFGAALPVPVGQFTQYQAVGKVRVDPNNSNKVVAGTKTGLYMSYDGGNNWTGPCTTNAFNTQRQDITGLELTNIGGTTRIIAAVGVRGFASTVQFNLDQNGANGIYKGTVPNSGCPSDFVSIASNANGFVNGGLNVNLASGTPYASLGTGDQAGRIDLAVAPSNPNYIYAQVQSITANPNAGCGSASGCQLGVWVTIDGGNSWTIMTGSPGASLLNCAGGNTSNNPGDYPQNWYDQGMAVDPNNPDRVFVDTYDTWFATRTGTSFYNVTCGYNGSPVANHVVHTDHHALAFIPGSSSMLLEGSDGGIFGTANANTAQVGTRPTWFNMDNNLNTIEFYSGDISANFANATNPVAVGGAQDNGPSSVTFSGSPTASQWQMGTGGDGFFARIDPVGTGTSLRLWEGNNSGGLSRCITNCTNSGATWTSKRGSWTADTQSFILPWELFHGDTNNPANDCPAAAPGGGCGHLVAGTVRIWETITGNAANSGGTVTWYVNSPANLTKQSLGNRSFINQLAFEPSDQTRIIVGTNDGNVQIARNMGTGSNQSIWTNVTDGNTVLPNRPVLDVAFDPTTTSAPIGYAAVGGFNQNTPSTPGHVFRVVCTTNCASFTWADKSGNLPNIPVDSIIANPNFPQQVFAGTDFGLYYTDNITAVSPVWYRFNAGLPNVMIWDMAIDRGNTTLSLWTRGRGAFAWPLPLGPTNSLSIHPITWTNVVNATATGNSLTKNNGTNFWGDSGAVSVEQILAGDGYVEVTASETTTHRIVGLSNGDANQSYSDVVYGMYMAAGNLCVNENYTARGCFGTYGPGDLLRVAVQNGVVKYSKNGAVFYTSTVAPVYPLDVDTSLFSAGATINNAVLAGDVIGPQPGPPPVPSPTADPNLENVVWTNVIGASATGNNLTKNVATDWWGDSGGVSTRAILSGDGYLQFTASEFDKHRVIGLGNGDSNQSYTDVDFGIYLAAGKVAGNLCVNEAGVSQGCFGTFYTGDVLQVAVEGGVVKYKKNGTVFFTSSVAPVYPLLVDTSLYSSGATVTGAMLSGTNLGATAFPTPTPVPSPTPDAGAQNVVWNNVVNATANSNNLQKNSGADSWSDSGASSVQTIAAGNGYVRTIATETSTHKVFGLSNGDSNQSYADIDFGLYEAAGNLCVNEGGASRGCFGTYATGDVLTVAVTGGVVTYLKNGVVFYTSGGTPVLPLLLDTSLYSSGSTINNAVISTSTVADMRFEVPHVVGEKGTDLAWSSFTLPSIVGVRGETGRGRVSVFSRRVEPLEGMSPRV